MTKLYMALLDHFIHAFSLSGLYLRQHKYCSFDVQKSVFCNSRSLTNVFQQSIRQIRMKRNSTFKGIKTANLNFRSKGKKEHTALSTEDDPGSGFLVERLNKKLHNPGGLVAPLKWKFQIRQTIFFLKRKN